MKLSRPDACVASPRLCRGNFDSVTWSCIATSSPHLRYWHLSTRCLMVQAPRREVWPRRGSACAGRRSAFQDHPPACPEAHHMRRSAGAGCASRDRGCRSSPARPCSRGRRDQARPRFGRRTQLRASAVLCAAGGINAFDRSMISCVSGKTSLDSSTPREGAVCAFRVCRDMADHGYRSMPAVARADLARCGGLLHPMRAAIRSPLAWWKS